MSVIEQLKLDHKNVAHLLNILEDQLLRVNKLKSADFDLIRDVMDYMTHYPDEVHHPLEDIVIEKLIELEPSANEIASTIVREHKGLSEKGQVFFEVCSQVVDDVMVLREDFEAKGHDYVGFLRQHMRKEDERLFPLAEKSLKQTDWDSVSESMDRYADPVFGEVVTAKYRDLFAYIELQSS